jgi:hypothetical protein
MPGSYPRQKARGGQGQGGYLKIVLNPAPGIPQGCQKVARGERSAAPGIGSKENPRPGGTPGLRFETLEEAQTYLFAV